MLSCIARIRTTSHFVMFSYSTRTPTLRSDSCSAHNRASLQTLPNGGDPTGDDQTHHRATAKASSANSKAKTSNSPPSSKSQSWPNAPRSLPASVLGRVQHPHPDQAQDQAWRPQRRVRRRARMGMEVFMEVGVSVGSEVEGRTRAPRPLRSGHRGCPSPSR